MKIDHENFDKALRRMFLITQTLGEETFEAVKNQKFEELRGICEMEATQNRLQMYCCRVINTQGNSMFEHPSLMYLLVQRLEAVADDYKYICRNLEEKSKFQISKETEKYFAEINETLRTLVDFYYKFDLEKGKKIIETKKKLIPKGLELLDSVPKRERVLIHILNNLLVRIYDTSSPIYGIYL